MKIKIRWKRNTRNPAPDTNYGIADVYIDRRKSDWWILTSWSRSPDFQGKLKVFNATLFHEQTWNIRVAFGYAEDKYLRLTDGAQSAEFISLIERTIQEYEPK